MAIPASPHAYRDATYATAHPPLTTHAGTAITHTTTGSEHKSQLLEKMIKTDAAAGGFGVEEIPALSEALFPR